jgi:dipeptidase E
MELLLLSNSQAPGREPFAHVAELLRPLVSDADVLFVPYALADRAGFTARLAAQLGPLGARVMGIDTFADPVAAVRAARVLFVGGGNTFRLLAALRRAELLDVVRDRVQNGRLTYIGSSAGSNVAAPTIRTTNDMPIVGVPDLRAFNLVPFQINPHFIDADAASTHMGETRAQRLEQFLEENDVPVVGLREGAWLHRRDAQLELGGPTGGVLFQRGTPMQALEPGADLERLLRVIPRYDAGNAS